MASVNFEKCKDARSTKARIRHCCKASRIYAKHTNKHINKSLTKYNWDYVNADTSIVYEPYEAAKDIYDTRIDYLDGTTNTNHKPDRVTCFGLEIPAPAGIDCDLEKASKWSHDVVELIIRKYGEENVVSAHFHADEKHKYKVKDEDGKIKTIESRYHMHVYVIPEINGKLNGKQFSSRKNMIKLNNEIEKMTLEKYGCRFMDGTKRKSRKTVEELKNQSDMLEIQQKQEQLNAEIAKVQALAVQMQQEHDNMVDTVFGEINKELENLEFNNGQTLKAIVAPYVPQIKNRIKNNDSTLYSSTINDERLKRRRRRDATDELINKILANDNQDGYSDYQK